MTAGYTLGVEPSGREHIVLAVKGSFDFPSGPSGACTLSEVQDPLLMVDEFWGEPGFSAQRYEMDYALTKPRCDVLINGSAHAPDGRPVERVRVGVKIGDWSKRFDVVGDRAWVEGVVAPGITAPRPFLSKQITYDVAFGGVDDLDQDEALPDSYTANPSGRGWHRLRNQNRINGAPLPNTEAPGEPVTSPWGTYRPMSFGPIARGWPMRLKYGGTYDQDWIDNVFPFLPADFDTRFYQAAPEDQQIEYPSGGETVTLVNLTPEGKTQFRLPSVAVPVVFGRKRREDVQRPSVLDTIVIEPDRARINLTWRTSIPLENDIFEVPEAIVGHRSRGFWRARKLGKPYYGSLGAAVRARASETGDA